MRSPAARGDQHLSAKTRILVVDDERSMQEFLEIFFGSEGFDVVTAGNVEAGRMHLENDSFDILIHPDHGNLLVQEYYQLFENQLSPEGKKGMNFFFQDELHLPIDNAVWSEDFAEVFREKKAYNIEEYLPALFFDIGDISAKVRLDYYDVMVELVERRYFKPIFEWHWQRGKLFGCDNWGRGLNPAAYGDYFRATRWFSAPGNDAPNQKVI